MKLAQAARAQFVRCFDYAGRSSRSEYWYAALFNFLVSTACSIIDAATGYPVLGFIAELIFFLPGWGLLIRRLHDIDRSGWWILAPFAPAFGIAGFIPLRGQPLAFFIIAITVLAAAVLTIMLLVWLCRAGSPGPNRFGPNPLARDVPAA